MNRSICALLVVAFFVSVTSAASGFPWTAEIKRVKFVQYGKEAGVDYVQIGTTDGLYFNYRANFPDCSSDGVKVVIAMALSAQTSGEEVHFKRLVQSQDISMDFNNILVGPFPQ